MDSPGTLDAYSLGYLVSTTGNWWTWSDWSDEGKSWLTLHLPKECMFCRSEFDWYTQDWPWSALLVGGLDFTWFDMPRTHLCLWTAFTGMCSELWIESNDWKWSPDSLDRVAAPLAVLISWNLDLRRVFVVHFYLVWTFQPFAIMFSTFRYHGNRPKLHDIPLSSHLARIWIRRWVCPGRCGQATILSVMTVLDSSGMAKKR